MRRWVLIWLLIMTPGMSYAATKYTDNLIGPSSCTNYAPASRACSGGSATAYKTINAAVPTLVAGDTLYIRAGTYVEAIDSGSVFIPSGTSWSNPITISGYQNETVLMRPLSSAGSGDNVITINGYGIGYTVSYLIFQNLILDGNVIGKAITLLGAVGTAASEVHHIRFQNIEAMNAGQSEACVGGGNDKANIAGDAHDIEFLASRIHDCHCSYGFYISGKNWLVDGNEIYNNAGYAVQVYVFGGSGVNNNTVRNNRMHGNGFVRGLPAITLNSGSGSRVYNNIVYGNHAGIDVGMTDNVSDQRVYNNTVYSNQAEALQIGGSASGTSNQNAVIQNNIFYLNGTNSIVSYSPSNATISNNLFSDPGFANPAGDDLHLSCAGCGAVNTGVNLSTIFTTDAEGAARAAGGAWDLGAYVYGASVPPEPIGNVAKYTFESLAGSVVADSSGQNHPCTMLPNAGTTTGIIGPVAFLGNGVRYCEATGASALQPTAEAGLSVWFKGTTTLSSGAVLLALPHDSLIIYILPSGIATCQAYDGTSFLIAQGGASVLNNVANHISCSYGQTDGMRLRINNAQVAFTPTPNPLSYALAGFGNLQVGRSDTSAGFEFQGALDQVYVFDQLITAAGNTNLYNDLVPGPGLTLAHMGWYATGTPGVQLGSIDTDLPAQVITTPLAFRFAIHKADPGSLTEYFRPMCVVNTGAGFPAWASATEVTNAFGTLGVRYYADAAISQGDPTSALLPLDGFTPVAGKILKSPIDTTNPYDAAQRVTIASGQHASVQYQFEFGAPLVTTNQVQCRLIRENGADFDTYAHIQKVTLTSVSPPTGVRVGGISQGGTQ